MAERSPITVLSAATALGNMNLASLSLDQLEAEPPHLKTAMLRARADLQDDAYRNFRAVLSSSNCVAQVGDALAGLDAKVALVSSSLPSFTDACSVFCARSSLWHEKRQRHRMMAQNQMTLLELLEIPQLAETCVRQQLYDDALNLEQYAQSLHARHASAPVLGHLIHEMECSSRTLICQLLATLQGPLQLPACLRAIGFLRRMSVLSELELRSEFLSRREAFLAEQISEIASPVATPAVSMASASYTYLSKYIDMSRIYLFEIITHFRAVFTNAADAHDDRILSFWLVERVDAFLGQLEHHLSSISEGAFLSSLLDQAMHCCLTLSRVGFDFRALVFPVFERRMGFIIAAMCKASIASFSESFSTHEWSVDSSLFAKLGLRDDASADNACVSNSTASLLKMLTPPATLLEHPPLALLSNGLIAALNELRSCTVFAPVDALQAVFSATVIEVVNTLRKFAMEASLSAQKQDALASMKQMVGTHLVPFLSKALLHLLGTGLSSSTMANFPEQSSQ